MNKTKTFSIAFGVILLASLISGCIIETPTDGGEIITPINGSQDTDQPSDYVGGEPVNSEDQAYQDLEQELENLGDVSDEDLETLLN